MYQLLQEGHNVMLYQAKIDFWAQIAISEDTDWLQHPFDNASLSAACQLYINKRDFLSLVKLVRDKAPLIMSHPHMSPDSCATATQTMLNALQTTLERFPELLGKREFATNAYSIMLDLFNQSISVLKVGRYVNEYLSSCGLACRIVRTCLTMFPDRSQELFQLLKDYLLDAEIICRQIRRTLLSQVSLKSWLQTRHLVSSHPLLSIYSYGVETFMQMDDAWYAWNFLQRLRARAFLDVLYGKETLKGELFTALTQSSTVSPMLEEDARLVDRAQYATEADYAAAALLVGKYSEKLAGQPSVRLLLEDETDPTRVWNELRDIWAIAAWLPTGQNGLLIDWFIGASRKVYWLGMSFKGTLKTLYWRRLGISMEEITRWKNTFLQFPTGEERPLEDVRSLDPLRELLSGVDLACYPGDLLVFVAPAELARIPLHAIPFGKRKPIIDRNPIMYASSIAHLRHALIRLRHRSTNLDSPLRNSYFTAAYEEPGHGDEREDIMTQVSQLSEAFGGEKLLWIGPNSDNHDNQSSAGWLATLSWSL